MPTNEAKRILTKLTFRTNATSCSSSSDQGVFSFSTPAESLSQFSSSLCSKSVSLKASVDSNAELNTDLSGQSTSAAIPYELFLHICSFLSEDDYLTLLGVSRCFHRAITEADSVVWHSLCFRKWKYRQGCYNLVVYFDQLEKENQREECTVTLLTQRMLRNYLKGLTDTDRTTCGNLPQPSLGLPFSFHPEKDGADNAKWLGNSISGLIGNTEKQNYKAGKRKKKKRRGRKGKRLRKQKRGTKRSQNYKFSRKKGYRQHHKKNRKMSKSARRRLRRQRAKQRHLQLPLLPTATYQAIQSTTSLIPTNELNPTSLLTNVSDYNSSESQHSPSNCTDRRYWWQLSHEERQLLLARQGKKQQNCSRAANSRAALAEATQGTTGKDGVDSKKHQNFSPLCENDIDDSSSDCTKIQSGALGRRVLFCSQVVQGEPNESYSIGSSSLPYLWCNGIGCTGIENALMVSRQKSLVILAYQREQAHLLAAEKGKNCRFHSLSMNRSFLCTSSAQNAIGLFDGKLFEGKVASPVSERSASYESISFSSPVVPYIPLLSPSKKSGKESARESSLAFDHLNISQEADEEPQEVQYEAISWKFAYFKSRREARRITITLHDLIKGVWMICFRGTKKYHPVQFSPDYQVTIFPPLVIFDASSGFTHSAHFGHEEVSTTFQEYDEAETPNTAPVISTAVNHTLPSCNTITLNIHIMQSGACIALDSMILRVYHRSCIANNNCRNFNSTNLSFESTRAGQSLWGEEVNLNETIARLREAAENLVVGRVSQNFTENEEPPNSTSKTSANRPLCLTSALHLLFGWENTTLDLAEALPRTVSEERKIAVDDDWGWTIGNDHLAFVSLDVSSPLYIQCLQRFSGFEEPL